jgi:hypothetical protein
MSAEQYNPEAEQQGEKMKTPLKDLDVKADSEQKKKEIQKLYSGFIERFPAAKGSLDAKKKNCLDKLLDAVDDATDKTHEVAEDIYDKIASIFE